jgi:hypothetical protein
MHYPITQMKYFASFIQFVKVVEVHTQSADQRQALLQSLAIARESVLQIRVIQRLADFPSYISLSRRLKVNKSLTMV